MARLQARRLTVPFLPKTSVADRDVAVLVPAAGAGRRMGGVQKPLLELRGRPVLAWAIQPFLDHPAVVEIVVAVPADVAAAPPMWLTESPRVRVISGGETRTDSVGAALAAVSDSVRRVVIHDGARPLVRREWIDACLEVCAEGAGGVIGYPAVDTIKEVAGLTVVSTPDRSKLWQVQTPQAFPREMLERAYRERGAGDAPSDDAALVERSGGAIRVVEGGTENVKITRVEDVAVVEALLAQLKL
jgi:2-C-methyl-D-erythritol 4-phosphate cytidylyltransferase